MHKKEKPAAKTLWVRLTSDRDSKNSNNTVINREWYSDWWLMRPLYKWFLVIEGSVVISERLAPIENKQWFTVNVSCLNFTSERMPPGNQKCQMFIVLCAQSVSYPAVISHLSQERCEQLSSPNGGSESTDALLCSIAFIVLPFSAASPYQRAPPFQHRELVLWKLHGPLIRTSALVILYEYRQFLYPYSIQAIYFPIPKACNYEYL